MRSAITFLLNGALVSVDDARPDTMALPWLRAHGLVSVKEGCNEGDCGACTVALGEPGPDGFAWRAVNSCILFLGQIDGQAVLTVEGLKGLDGSYHPAQSVLAEGFGTQCGYCSPGFVMSLFVLSRRPERDDETILDAIAGNLCRCTGYRPIVEAARGLPHLSPPEDETAQAARLLDATAAPLDYRGGGGRLFAPHALADALAFRAGHPDARVLAGGTDLGLQVTKKGERLNRLLSLARVAELHRLEEGAGRIRIGAAASYGRVLPVLAARHPGIVPLLRRIGATQVRAMGSVGGNLGTASPIGDTMPALIALGAEVEVAGPGGRRRVAVEDFVTGYRTTELRADELITAVEIPDLEPGTRFAAYKIAKRVDQDISTVLAAFALRLDRSGRVAMFRAGYGGMGPRPIRARAAEEAVIGREWNEAVVAAAREALDAETSPMSDFRGSREYRALVAGNLLTRFLYETSREVAA